MDNTGMFSYQIKYKKLLLSSLWCIQCELNQFKDKSVWHCLIKDENKWIMKSEEWHRNNEKHTKPICWPFFLSNSFRQDNFAKRLQGKYFPFGCHNNIFCFKSYIMLATLVF